MKQKIIAMMLVLTMVMVTACSGSTESAESSEETTEAEEQETDAEEDEEEEAQEGKSQEEIEETAKAALAEIVAEPGEEVALPAITAVYSGEGPSWEGVNETTAYDEETETIINIGEGSEITYTMPEGVEGTYDVYITITKELVSSSSQQFNLSINGETPYALYLSAEAGADSEFAGDDGGYDTGKMTDQGVFPVQESVELKAGDTITFDGVFGSASAGLKGKAFPALGELLLYPAGTEVTIGYEGEERVPSHDVDESDPLSGKTIFWLGSSVTLGAYSGSYSMADALRDSHQAMEMEKYAISGTRLVNELDNSYVARLELVDTEKTPDLFIVQLSTNDATTGKPLGDLTDSKDPSTFDDTTITGAIETIIAYVEETFGCPVIFYTGTYYESEEYAAMVERMLEIQEKWDIGVIDLYNDPEMTALYGTETYDNYMYDEIHPNREGYIEWWTPVFDEYLTEYFSTH